MMISDIRRCLQTFAEETAKDESSAVRIFLKSGKELLGECSLLGVDEGLIAVEPYRWGEHGPVIDSQHNPMFVDPHEIAALSIFRFFRAD